MKPYETVQELLEDVKIHGPYVIKQSGKVILDVAHIIGVFERNNTDEITGKPSFDIEVILEYNGRTFSQFLTYGTKESRQYEMNRLVLALPDCD